MKEKNLSALHSDMDILTSGLDILCNLNLKDNLTDSTAKKLEKLVAYNRDQFSSLIDSRY